MSTAPNRDEDDTDTYTYDFTYDKISNMLSKDTYYKSLSGHKYRVLEFAVAIRVYLYLLIRLVSHVN